MDIVLLKNITIGAFFILIIFFVILSIMSAYVFIRYGRTVGVTVIITLIFAALFTLGTLSSFVLLKNIF